MVLVADRQGLKSNAAHLLAIKQINTNFERLLIKISQKRDTQPPRQLHQYIRARCGFDVKRFPQTQPLARGL